MLAYSAGLDGSSEDQWCDDCNETDGEDRGAISSFTLHIRNLETNIIPVLCGGGGGGEPTTIKSNQIKQIKSNQRKPSEIRAIGVLVFFNLSFAVQINILLG
ncbi:hypothetical protein L1987_67204 [Smallanthus sonchifolius]|uniref:Uncharacterized protein n=1 Tax=Smallanthus sonchifolius TaxID=185202 RepID=A0ACB9BZI8_9ASTR|nr:hypothetical protein L1987_67204 [Smallanthus sonchifolius]